MSAEHGERRELKVTLSVAVLVSANSHRKLLLVQDAETGQWSPPAGGLEWLVDQKRMETFTEGVERELQEEIGQEVGYLRLRALVNLPGKGKNRIGAIYTAVLDSETNDFVPADPSEISAIRPFSEDELIDLLKQDGLTRMPEFNRGLIVWWLRNSHRDSWDPYRGAEPLDDGRELDERYLQEWLTKPIEELFKS